jgi:hypothetical protein
MVQENQGLVLKGPLQLLVCVDINVLDENINAVKTEALLRCY